jgi:hypothetical protein
MVRTAPGPGSIHEAVEAVGAKAVTPFRHRGLVDTEINGDLCVRATLGAGEHDATSQSQCLGRGVPARPSFERPALVGAESDLGSRPSSTWHVVPPIFADKIGERTPRTENSPSVNISWLINLTEH